MDNYKSDFEDWFQKEVIDKTAFPESQIAIILAFKEVAQKAWNEALTKK